jgi:hypothetical protein
MSVKASKNRFSFDSLLELRSASAAAMTADTSTTAISLNTLSSYWDTAGDQSVPMEFAVIIEVSAYTIGGSSVDAIATVQSAIVTDSAFGGTVSAISSKTITGTGRFVILVSRDQLAAVLAGYLRVNFDVAASGSPSVTAAVYIAPVQGN